jgi:hypothetical protein
VLDKKKTEIGEERLSKKDPMSDADAKKLLASVSKVIVAKGKAFREMDASDATLADLRGPTGNFRAPMIRKGKTLLVGFHPPTLETLVG